jgi:hypothetical protein
MERYLVGVVGVRRAGDVAHIAVVVGPLVQVVHNHGKRGAEGKTYQDDGVKIVVWVTSRVVVARKEL